MAKEEKQAPEGYVYVTYIKDGSKAKKGEEVCVLIERAEVLKELGYIK